MLTSLIILFGYAAVIGWPTFRFVRWRWLVRQERAAKIRASHRYRERLVSRN